MHKLFIHNKLVCLFIVLGALLFLNSCSSTRYLADDEKLFVKNKISVDRNKANLSDLKKYQRITPNKKVLGVRFHLYIYNLANPEKEKFPHKWFRKIGEPPVIYDSVLINTSRDNFLKYVNDKGFNKAEVDVKTKVRRKKAKVKYDIVLNNPTLVRSIRYEFKDTAISRYVLADTINSLLQTKGNFDKFLFKDERQRIEDNLKNEGYFAFSREFVHYEVFPLEDTALVDVKVILSDNKTGAFDPTLKVRPHRQYRIDNVFISPSRIRPNRLLTIDTVMYQNHTITYLGKPTILPSALVNANSVLPGELYSKAKVSRTYTDYSNLRLFRYINVSFTEQLSATKEGLLDCKIELDMRKRQSYAVEFNLTNSGGDLGVRGGVTYNNYNLFRGGEHLQLGVISGIESLNNRYRTIEDIDPMKEFGFLSRLETPKFLLPFRAENFQRKYKPRTEFLFSYNYQNQPKYNRTIANTSFGYNWKGNVFNRHTIHPLDFYLVKVPFIDSAFFADNYEDTRLENSFTNHAILGGRYSFEFSNQQLKRGISFIYFKFNFETAGLLLNQVNRLTNWGSDSLFFGVQYFQYLKADIDFRNYNIITPRNRIVYRLFAGVGLPYGNSEAMPFEKMYWSGGPYSMRAWGERTLGPGSYSNTIGSYNQLGDIKLEANFEYRFKLFWKAEGALFADIGNVWLLTETSKFPDSGFEIRSFYKDLAVGVGTGLRLDLSFVVLRTDFAFKMRDPALGSNVDSVTEDEQSKWTFRNPNAKFGDMTFQFGIGYPF